MLKYNIALNEDGEGVISIFLDGNIETIDTTHPNFTRIMQAVVEGEDPTPLLSVESAVTRIDDRVSIVDEVLHFDGNPVHDHLANTILRYTREGRDTRGLVRFMERLASNPSRRSREQLFEWTQAKDITIDEDGYFVGYKGVSENMTSISAGFAIVNGKEHNGNIPNAIGSVIEMPREMVQDDPNQGCSYGLHVGNYSYARGFGRVLLEVKVDPADVVSVPADCSFQKLRCCKYEVLDIHELPEDDLSEYEPEAGWDDDDAYEALSPVVPSKFLERFRSKFRKN